MDELDRAPDDAGFADLPEFWPEGWADDAFWWIEEPPADEVPADDGGTGLADGEPAGDPSDGTDEEAVDATDEPEAAADDGSADDDILDGTADGDILGGAGGSDVIAGLGGDDQLDGAGGDDVVEGDDGNDLVAGGEGDDVLSGGEGGDAIDGGTGDDHVEGGAGDDLLGGGEGDDVLIGDAGDDVMAGGSGCDLFILDLATGGGSDTVLDFTGGEDLVWICGDGASWEALDDSGDGVLDGQDRAVSIVAGSTVIDLSALPGGGPATLTLAGVTGLGFADIIVGG
ncbi:MAG: calcium-binding protein [Geminicoccaceae bacterium]